MLISYVVFNVLNVIIQTIKSIVTIKCNKYIAAVVNAVAYGLYTYVIILTNVEIDLWFKIITVALANLIGVFVVKYFEEKNQKECLWKVEATITKEMFSKYKEIFERIEVPHNYIDIDKYTIINFYCATRKQSELTKEFLTTVNAKYFVTESKIL